MTEMVLWLIVAVMVALGLGLLIVMLTLMQDRKNDRYFEDWDRNR